MGIEKFEEFLDNAVEELGDLIMDILTEGADVIVYYTDDGEKEVFLEFHDDRAELIFLELVKDAGEGSGPAIKVVERFKAALFEKADTM